MRNYIILNGQSSTTIQGLLISSLPPITKPLIRTTVEEVDGRDGDIITKLGYAAYTKELSIGLYGDFDIDSIISYFNSEGTVVFSNEPDKYYKYQILEQIDYERLIRFRTATVRFHIQPFKYSLTDNEKTFNIDSNLISLSNYTLSSNNVTLTATSNGVITLKGTPTKTTEFYLPVSVTLNDGSFKLSLTTTGTANSTEVRLIKDTTTNTFGDNALVLSDNAEVNISDTISTETTYNYLYFSISDTVNFTLDAELINLSPANNIQIRNAGNIYSKPTITIYGAGSIEILLNNMQIFSIDMGTYTSITIDTNLLEAYNGSTLLNRQVTGDYDKFKLNTGLNTISWNGDINKIDISNYSRWI